MKHLIKNTLIALVSILIISSCTKYKTDIDATANTANAAASNSTLNNRITLGFIANNSTLPNLPTSLISSLTTFRRFQSYDTTKRTGFFPDTVPVYKAGDVITLAAFLKGDDFAITKRKINFGLFKAPSTFITPANPPAVINVMTRAEDSYRSYQPGAQTSATAFSPVADSIISLPSIVTTSNSQFEVTPFATEIVGGINYTTYLVQLKFTIPAAYNGKFVSGNVMSINFNNGATFGFTNTAEVAGNINWIYAFRIK